MNNLTFNTQHSTFNTQHSTFNTQHSTFNTPHFLLSVMTTISAVAPMRIGTVPPRPDVV